ncbi:MAG TPA: DUF1844 domain-containing protein [Thermoanaerobaculia bacterium]
MAEQEEKPIRVVDRRMFTPEGDLRTDFEPEEIAEAPPGPPPPPPSSPPQPEAPRSETAPSGAREPRSAFGSLVGWIATNAYSALGLLPDAAGQAHADLAIARQMIEWLALLEQKTRGNLSFEESDFLSRAIYELRLAFVEVTRPKSR